MCTPSDRWSTGALTAVGIGVGAALAAPLGPAGWAFGLMIPGVVAGTRAIRHR